ncbi:HlyD family secretion protein [uncultured Thiothrix sp.]|uniref:HlyD family secretion protein n=1 Tax=uncultured Thiothrix sp. TaxID=223185 RepID=UPI00261DF26D|nr:HlyD family secretion protein [uncultured Thiothrix sp.]
MWDSICSLLLSLSVQLSACQADTPPSLNGYIETEVLRIAATTSGRIDQMYVNTGDQVAKDQPLFALDSEAIRSPKAAQVENRYYQAEEWVNAGTPVLSLVAADQYKIRFFLPETALGSIKVGDPLRYQCDGCSSTQQATIRFIANSAEYTPPVLYTKEQRAKLVYLVEASPIDPSHLHAGQPVSIWLNPPTTQ